MGESRVQNDFEVFDFLWGRGEEGKSGVCLERKEGKYIVIQKVVR